METLERKLERVRAENRQLRRQARVAEAEVRAVLLANRTLQNRIERNRDDLTSLKTAIDQAAEELAYREAPLPPPPKPDPKDERAPGYDGYWGNVSAEAAERACVRVASTLSDMRDGPNGRPIHKELGWISSEFGMRMHPILNKRMPHEGIDIAAVSGTPVRATAPGRVERAGYIDGYGNAVEISHRNGRSTMYAHMSDIHVRKGDKVRRGDQVGEVGNTGRSTGPHLHYEVIENGKAVDPQHYLDRSEAALKALESVTSQ